MDSSNIDSAPFRPSPPFPSSEPVIHSDEERNLVERPHVVHPTAGDELHFTPPWITSNTLPSSSRQYLAWPQSLTDQSDWASTPLGSGQSLDPSSFDMNIHPSKDADYSSTIQDTAFLNDILSPLTSLDDTEDWYLQHYPALIRQFDEPADQKYSQYNPTLEQTTSKYRISSAMELNGSPVATQQDCTDSEQTFQSEDIPYSQLIYQALMSVEDHRMKLQDIYKWIAENTDKAADPTFTGWQNTVRHDLSRNSVSPCFLLSVQALPMDLNQETTKTPRNSQDAQLTAYQK